MVVDVTVPSVGESINQGILSSWLKQNGDLVEEGDDLFELETDKATIAVPAPGFGRLKIRVEPGAEVEVGQVVGSIEPGEAATTDGEVATTDGEAATTDGEAATETSEAATETSEAATETSEAAAEPGAAAAEPAVIAAEPAAAAAHPAAAHAAAAHTVAAQRPTARVSGTHSPAVSRILALHKLDPARIEGSGKGGRLTKGDVLQAAALQTAKLRMAAQKTAQAQDRMLAEAAARQAATRQAAAPPAAAQQAAAPPAAAQQTAAQQAVAQLAAAQQAAAPPAAAPPAATPPVTRTGPGTVAPNMPVQRRVPMSPVRKTIARHLLQAKQNAAHLTTFNEVDMKNIMDWRRRYGENFRKAHGIKLGFMSFFVTACCQALKAHPALNAQIDGEEIVYNDYYDIGIAVSTEKGLLVPVLRGADRMTMPQIEQTISDLAGRVRDRRIGPDELAGGTFTITNGGVFGSLLSTPIPNHPQSAILGMHTIQNRPVALGDEVAVRPMMYLAVSYDHRLIDGREAVSFLVNVKELLEDPARLLLEA